MGEAVYKIVELTGTSQKDIEGAIQNAVSKASQTIRNMRWFQVVETRGNIENGKIAYWQVTLKAGFNVDRGPEKPAAGPGQEVSAEKKVKARYRCTVCGYIYDPEKGDPDNGIKPGTAFEDLPGDWVCPECGVAKERFEKIEE